jgi:hypothetical protein
MARRSVQHKVLPGVLLQLQHARQVVLECCAVLRLVHAIASEFLREEGLKDKQLDSELIPVQKAVFQLAKSGGRMGDKQQDWTQQPCRLQLCSLQGQSVGHLARRTQVPSGVVAIPLRQSTPALHLLCVPLHRSMPMSRPQAPLYRHLLVPPQQLDHFH